MMDSCEAHVENEFIQGRWSRIEGDNTHFVALHSSLVKGNKNTFYNCVSLLVYGNDLSFEHCRDCVVFGSNIRSYPDTHAQLNVINPDNREMVPEMAVPMVVERPVLGVRTALRNGREEAKVQIASTHINNSPARVVNNQNRNAMRKPMIAPSVNLRIKVEEKEKKNLLYAEIKESDACVLCLSRPPSIVFIPCGHIAICATCVDDLARSPMGINKCIHCRASIEQLHVVYLTNLSACNASGADAKKK